MTTVENAKNVFTSLRRLFSVSCYFMTKGRLNHCIMNDTRRLTSCS